MDKLRFLKTEKLKRLKAPKLILSEVLFDKQLAVAQDKNTFVSLLTTRRGGKSTFFGADALEAADQYPGSDIPFIALTRDSAERIVWKTLKDFVEKYKLPYRMLDASLEIKTPRGSTVFLVGADQKNFIQRLRGAKFPKVFIDEAQGFGSHLQELVQDVLEACVSDYNGQIYLSGTPGPVPRGFFYEACHGKHGFTNHKWSVLDNPHLPHITKEWMDDMLKRKGQTRDNPTFKREWLGEWVEDLDALVYKYKAGRNDYSGDVPRGTTSILAIDFGFNDKTTFTTVRYHPNSPRIWISRSEGHQGWIPTQIALRTKQIMDNDNISQVVADTGGLGKSIAEELRRRYSIPVQAAEKTDKFAWIALMNGDFIDGNILIHEDLVEYKDQLQTLAKDDKGKEDPSLPNDFCDGGLYGYRHAYAYAHKAIRLPEPDPVKRFDKKEQEWLKREAESARKEAAKEWWEKYE